MEHWAEGEFGGADLGDARRTRRLVQIAAGAGSDIGSALSSTCGKSGAQAISRLLSRAETTLCSVTEPHVERTRARCSTRGRVLAVQDTTVLDFTTHAGTEGIGPITTSAKSRGLLMHTVLAVSEDRVPLGILGIQVWARDAANRGVARERRSRLVGDKESCKWLIGLEQAQSATDAEQEVLVVGDRESDVYVLFAAPRRAGTELLIRLAHNRRICDGEYAYVRDAIAAAPVAGYMRWRFLGRGRDRSGWQDLRFAAPK